MFVSSRIGECAIERGIAKDAIKSLNHEPILFEDVGARPYTARETYEPRLRESQIFVAIYRDGYGDIVPGMNISGLEDEFNIACEVGLERLVYVRTDERSRDSRLTALIERAKSEVKISFYTESTDLIERLRSDITSEVARNFNSAREIAPIVEVNASQFLERLVPPAERLDRSTAQNDLFDALHKNNIVEVQGELGVGKTVVIATSAARSDWIFLAAQSDSPMQVASRLANLLRMRIGDSPVLVRSYAVAIAAVKDAWGRSKGTPVAIDGCPTSELINDIVAATGGPSSEYPLIFSLAGQAGTSVFYRFKVPSLTNDEVSDLWLMRFGTRPSTKQLAKLVDLSKGIALYLRYVRTPEDVEITDSALESIELRRWRDLSPLTRDIVTYSCLSARPVPMEALIGLTGEKDLMNALEQASVLTLETAEGFSPIHQHLRTTIRAELGRSPARHAYYASALGRHLARTGDYLSAFFVLDAAGRPDARRIVARASFEAAQQGDFRSLTRVLRRRVEFLASAGPSRELFATVAGLAQAEDNTGDAESARGHWQATEKLAGQLGDTTLTSQFRAEALIREALATTSSGSLEALVTLRAELAASNEKWLAAKIALDLSGVFIRIGREKDAAENAEAAVSEFDSLGDTYGTELARRNLASALSQVLGREEEAARLAEKFTREDVVGSKRLQAFRCNLLFRAARKRGDNEQAGALASEALAIGEELQDVWVIIANTINLANVRRDENKSGEALALYNKVSEMARRSGLRTQEAIASRHAAEVHNQRKEFILAKSYAEYAVAVLRETAAEVELAIALEERADAERGLGDRLIASTSYLEAAGHLLDPSDKRRKARLLSQAASLYLEADDPDRFFGDFGKLYGCATGEKLSVALALLDKIATELPSRGIFGVLNVYFRFLFRSAPAAINRRLFRLITERIVGISSPDTHVHLALIPLLGAIPATVLDLQMLVETADGLHRNVKPLSFKPNADLSVNYVTELDLGLRTVLSFTQIDDLAETAAITTILALFFLGFQEEISRNILEGNQPERPEVKISVISLAEAKAANLPVDLEAGRNFAVTRPADLGEEGIPTFVFYRDGLLGTWEGKDYLNGLLGLLATVLMEVIFRLLKSEVDSDTLHRNIVRVTANLL